ncbi:farnesyl diphosphate synthase [Oceaniovalibus guishaninsula JLT2003]|uniref:Geranylgeranyl diphosphate synthase n=1 Tax=Oceaniovalibus guishaninsula JLT2003 TaxID=1231392 RepID=K2HAQ9_9RHOB|nr:polyprenyl synthetase family protein [Oceaniovalibus guishaninsula]EKE44593.1 farnesyl diphosphate synthase [Oceaniovalibus guishaninsula JLT2003]
MTFHDRLDSAARQIDALLRTAVRGDLPVHDAMRHALTGGKRLRGFLVIEGAALHGVADATVAAAAIEALHAYSLVHDDLPCMDDDDLRRGQPTVHVRWDEATAVLAGDALQTLAFDLLSDPACHDDPAVRCVLVSTLARAAGAGGMVLGQALDIAAETAGRPLTLNEVEALQAAKTGALIEWSGAAGAVLAEADPAPLTAYARALGGAFQIADDILDAEGCEDRAGKRLGKDAAAGKATFVSLLGMDAARQRAADLTDAACAALDGYGARAETLRDCARFVLTRDR